MTAEPATKQQPAASAANASANYKKMAELFARWVADKKVVVADTNSSSRAGLAKILINLGAKTANVSLQTSYEGAEEAIAKTRPHVVICDYNLGKKCGLDLLQRQRESNPDSKSTLFVLVTGNTSQSAVAQAAEEDIDAYVLKPYTIEVLCNTIIKTAIAKINPPEYIRKIEEGKGKLKEKKFEEANVFFQSAKALDSKPSLACFYDGQAYVGGENVAVAEGSFKEGLEFNKIHYKCMVGLYDLLMSKKKHADAYDVVKRIARYFPANPQRLTSVVRLAIMTKNYDDMERYYQLFTTVDTRNDELIRYVCAALVVCGKYYLLSNFPSRALDLFQKAGVTSGGRPKILREIILALAEHDLYKEAEGFLRRFPPDSTGTPDYLVMDLLIANHFATPDQTIVKARALLQQGVQEPLVYKILIQRSIDHGYKDNAENLVAEASKKWPDQAAVFTQAMEGSASEKGSGSKGKAKKKTEKQPEKEAKDQQPPKTGTEKS